jgi:hypothetical protein
MSDIWYGSVQNRIMERSNMPAPEVGMGVTRCMWSDREPYEVIEVQDERHIKVRKMHAKRIDKNGMSDCQDYIYTSNENGSVVDLFLTKQGRWRDRHGRKLGCDGWLIGKAEKYYDYSF